MIDLEVVGSAQVCAQRALWSDDEHCAAAGWRGRVNHVCSLYAIFVASFFHSFSVVVIADAAHISSGTRLLQHPLSNTDGVLSGSAGDVLDCWQLHHLRKKG